jgi:hypothetical protein
MLHSNVKTRSSNVLLDARLCALLSDVSLALQQHCAIMTERVGNSLATTST